MAHRTRLVWDDGFTAYDFGPTHPMGPVRLALTTRLAEALGVSAGTVSGILDRLTAAGMTVRTPDPTDGRVRRVTSTEKGSEAIRRLVAHDEDLPPDLLALLGVDDLRALTRGTRALLEAARTLGA